MARKATVTKRHEHWLVGSQGRTDKGQFTISTGHVRVQKVAVRNALGQFNGATNYRTVQDLRTV